jgi:16S rRNA (uracil1498-N3)-methyltransferase
LALGQVISVFDGVNGEWDAEITLAAKRGGLLTCVMQSQEQSTLPDLWLLFAPIKKARTDFIVEKAAEMGAAQILPVQTEFTNSDRIRHDRLQAHAVEAAEQCGGTYVPAVASLQKLSTVLDGWDPTRKLIFCDETLVGRTAADLSSLAEAPAAILIGPEGGFSPQERARLLELPFVQTLSLGPRILRADTAVVAALTLWQQIKGDWR